jgi:hypothetical protein
MSWNKKEQDIYLRGIKEGQTKAYLNILAWMEASKEKGIFKTMVKFIKQDLKELK